MNRREVTKNRKKAEISRPANKAEVKYEESFVSTNAPSGRVVLLNVRTIGALQFLFRLR